MVEQITFFVLVSMSSRKWSEKMSPNVTDWHTSHKTTDLLSLGHIAEQSVDFWDSIYGHRLRFTYGLLVPNASLEV